MADESSPQSITVTAPEGEVAEGSPPKSSASLGLQRKRGPEGVVDDAAVGRPAPGIQPRSHNRVCVTCRRRKVKCDKTQPCQNCTKAQIECVFPSKTSAGRQAAADAELLHELRRLEPMFKSLVSKIGDDGMVKALHTSMESIEAIEAIEEPQIHNIVTANPGPSPSTSAQPPPATTSPPLIIELPSLNASPMTIVSGSGSESLPWNPYGHTAGKLVKDKGRDRYISGSFWNALHTQHDDDWSDSISEESDSEDHGPVKSVASPENANYFLGGGEPSKTPSGPQHPPEAQRLKAWQLFKENVHPLAAILHIPTIEPVLIHALTSLDTHRVPTHLQPLVYVVYYGAITSISADSCQLEFNGDQATLLKSYRSCLEMSFANAKLLEADELPVLQAFVLFLFILRRHDPGLSWNLTGLAVRLAQSRGMHRDGGQLNLSRFDAEMRRRLWWNICLLDTASSEDHACAPTILELSSFDAALPRNVNDVDLHPNMTEDPPEDPGMTDICLTYARCRLTDLWRMVVDSRRPTSPGGKSFASMTTVEKEQWLGEQQHILEQNFSCKSSVAPALHWVTMTLVKTVLCGFRLFIYNPLAPDSDLTESERDCAFLCAIECMEQSYSLRMDQRSRKWSWLLSCYHEWFALAVVISEICLRPLGRYVDRAWPIVEKSVVLRWNSPSDHRRTHQWRSIIKSLDKAREERRKEVRRRRWESSQKAKFNKVATEQNMSLVQEHLQSQSQRESSFPDMFFSHFHQSTQPQSNDSISNPNHPPFDREPLFRVLNSELLPDGAMDQSILDMSSMEDVQSIGEFDGYPYFQGS